MTRRIALAILLTVWAILIGGCVTAYLVVRYALIEQLDESLMARASTLPELKGGPATAPSSRTDRYVIRSSTGQTLSPAAGGKAMSDVTLASASFSKLGDGTRLRSIVVRASVRDSRGADVPVTITYQGSAAHVDRLLDRLALAFALFGLCAGLLTAFVALRVSRRALAPLHATADVIGTINPANLHRRIEPAKLPVELLPMATRLNEMLDRIEEAYAHRQQFLADASHELRTPVAALFTTIEVALRHPRDPDAYRRVLESCLADTRLLRLLVERLMEQCRAQTLSHDEPLEQVDLAPLLAQCADQAQALGLERHIAIERQFPGELTVHTQPQRLRSIVINLLSNAVEYNRHQGMVTLSAHHSNGRLELSVADTGPGIAAEHLPHLFEPFYRTDRARSHEAGHLGLGLSLVQAHVQALSGQVRVESKVDVGTTFYVDLPMKQGELAPVLESTCP